MDGFGGQKKGVGKCHYERVPRTGEKERGGERRTFFLAAARISSFSRESIETLGELDPARVKDGRRSVVVGEEVEEEAILGGWWEGGTRLVGLFNRGSVSFCQSDLAFALTDNKASREGRTALRACSSQSRVCPQGQGAWARRAGRERGGWLGARASSS